MEGTGWGVTQTAVKKKRETCRERERVESKRRSDKREASTMEANKENPNGGINHCSTYPSSL